MRWQSDIEFAAAAWGIPVEWLAGIVGAESSFRDVAQTWEPNAGEYSRGPAQILPSTARYLGFFGDDGMLEQPGNSIYWGAANIAHDIGRYGLDFRSVISAYRAGHAEPVTEAAYIARVQGWIDNLFPAAAPIADDGFPAAAPIAADGGGQLELAAAGMPLGLILLLLLGGIYAKSRSGRN